MEVEVFRAIPSYHLACLQLLPNSVQKTDGRCYKCYITLELEEPDKKDTYQNPAILLGVLWPLHSVLSKELPKICNFEFVTL